MSQKALVAVTSLENVNGLSFKIVLSERIWLPMFSNDY